MTLILVAANSDYVVQLSDRRLSAGRKPVDEESNKSILLHLADGRLVVGFTGFAGFGAFNTMQFLTTAAMEAAKPDYSVAGLVERIPSVVTDRWRDERIPAMVRSADQRLMFSIAGCGPGTFFDGQPTPGAYFYSNVQRAGSGWKTLDHFREVKRSYVKSGVDLDTATYIHGIGSMGSVTDEAVAPIRSMLLEHRPAKAVVGKGVELMRGWARHRATANTVGDQVSSIIIPADPRDGWTFDYHTAHPTRTMYQPMFVDATGRRGGGMAVQWELTQEDGAFMVQKVGRNEPCPCGSGAKYKRCHGGRSTASKGSLV